MCLCHIISEKSKVSLQQYNIVSAIVVIFSFISSPSSKRNFAACEAFSVSRDELRRFEYTFS